MSNRVFTCINRGCRRKFDPQPGPFPDNHLINGYCWDCNLSQFDEYGIKSLDNVRLTREKAAKIQKSPAATPKRQEFLYISRTIENVVVPPTVENTKTVENTERDYND